MKTSTHMNKMYLLLTCILLGGTLQGMKEEKDDESRTAQDSRIAAWLNARAQNRPDGGNPDIASRERLRKSAINRGMREWQDTPAQAVPKTAAIQGCQIKLDDTITDAVPVPYTKKILMSAFNTLYRYDADTKTTQALAFARPITKLIQSTDGSLCAVLLEPSEDDYPLIHFVNSCKSSLELNSDIKPISYYQTEDYELGQEADLSINAGYLAAIINENTACIHNLKTNQTHTVLAKNEENSPVFSVNFLKTNTCESLLPLEHHKLVVHANLETTIHRVDQDGCTVLQTIDHRPQVTPKIYLSRQCAWILPGRLIVLLGSQLLAFNVNEKDTFELAKSMCLQSDQNELLQCNTNRVLFIEFNKATKKIILHNLLNLTSRALRNPNNDHVLMDESDTLAFVARKNELMLMSKEKPTHTTEKKSPYNQANDESTE